MQLKIPTSGSGGGQAKYIIIGAILVVILAMMPLLMIITVISSIGGDQAAKEQQQGAKEVPFQALYQEVASKYTSIPWTILAAVHFYSDEYDIHLSALSTGSAASLKGKNPTYLALVNKYAQMRGLDPLLVAAIIQQESNWNPKANSGATGCGRDIGARGLMQVMPCHYEGDGLDADDVGYDPETSIKYGTKIFKSCLDQFKATDVALACYNGGAGTVQNAGGRVPSSPKETAEYPGKVLAHYERFKAESNSQPVNEEKEKNKNLIKISDVKKWLQDKAESISGQIRIHSDSSRSSGQCTKTAKEKKEKGATIGTFSFPLSCGIFYTAPKKYLSNDDTTWDYVEMVEKKSQEYMGASGPISFGDLVMAGGQLPLPTPLKIEISSKFGCRVHPVTGVLKFHYGIDMPVPTNTPVIAVADGKVEYVKNDHLIGHSVMIDHGQMTMEKNGTPTTANFKSRYLHMISVSVKPGQQVVKGQEIAKSGGAQGIVYSTGAHLHFETYINGAVVNPYPLLTGKNDHPNMNCYHRTGG
jgi:murein DD-endopeptidase MepM/ murein hydrolase activator NlpD